MRKILKYGAVLLAAALGALIYSGWASDIPHAVLAEKYATGASDFIDLPSGTQAHFRIQGNDEGRTVVLLHGSNASLHTWAPLVEELEDDFLVITVDLPGHGLTGATKDDDYTYTGMAVFMAEFTKALELDRYILGGNSMGGAITLHYALEHPEKLDGLLLLDAAGIKTPERAAHKADLPLAFQLAGHWYSDWILENVTPRSMVIEGLKKGFTDHNLITEDMIDRYWELVLHPGNRKATGLRFASYREGRPDLPVENISLPSLILWGADDRLIPLEVGEDLNKRIAGSEFVVLQNVGHAPMEESPQETASAIKSFLSRLP